MRLLDPEPLGRVRHAAGGRPRRRGARRLSGRSGAAGWASLPFFADGSAEAVAARVDARIADGALVLPAPADVFRALRTTPLEQVKAVILGQDPYPTPGDAHGLAFSHVGPRRLPPSLRTILAEMADDLGVPLPADGRSHALGGAGRAAAQHGADRRGGQGRGASPVRLVGADGSGGRRRVGAAPAAAFLLWGGPARQRAALIDRDKHLVLESGHPSPLNRLGDFRGRRPFSRGERLAARARDRADRLAAAVTRPAQLAPPAHNPASSDAPSTKHEGAGQKLQPRDRHRPRGAAPARERRAPPAWRRRRAPRSRRWSAPCRAPSRAPPRSRRGRGPATGRTRGRRSPRRRGAARAASDHADPLAPVGRAGRSPPAAAGGRGRTPAAARRGGRVAGERRDGEEVAGLAPGHAGPRSATASEARDLDPARHPAHARRRGPEQRGRRRRRPPRRRSACKQAAARLKPKARASARSLATR